MSWAYEVYYYQSWAAYLALWALMAWAAYWVLLRWPRSIGSKLVNWHRRMVADRNPPASPVLIPSFSTLAAPGTTPLWPASTASSPQEPPVTDAAIRAEIQGLKVRIDRLHTMMERRS